MLLGVRLFLFSFCCWWKNDENFLKGEPNSKKMSVLYGGDYEKIMKISPKADQTAKKCTLIG